MTRRQRPKRRRKNRRQSGPKLSPNTLRTIAAGAIYAVMIALIIGPFLADAHRFLFDTRTIVGPGDDKVAEIFLAREGTLSKLLRMALGLQTQTAGTAETFNPLPLALTGLADDWLPTILGTNLILWGAWWATAMAAYLLVSEMTRNEDGDTQLWAGLVAGGIFAFSPFMVNLYRIRSLDYGLGLWIPLLFWAFIRCARRPTFSNSLTISAALLLLGATNHYYLLGTTLALTLLAPRSLFPMQDPDDPALRNRMLAIGLTVGVIALLPLIWSQAVSLHAVEPQIRQQFELRPGDNHHNIFQMAKNLRLSDWGAVPLLLYPLLLAKSAITGRGIVPRRWSVGWAGAGLLVGTLISFGTLPTPVGEWLADLPFLWRSRRLESTFVVVVLAGGVLAGLGVHQWGNQNPSNPKRENQAKILCATALVWLVIDGAHDGWNAPEGPPVSLPSALVKVAGTHSGSLLVIGAHPGATRLIGFHLAEWVGQSTKLGTVGRANQVEDALEAGAAHRLPFFSYECGLVIVHRDTKGADQIAHPLTTVYEDTTWTAIRAKSCERNGS